LLVGNLITLAKSLATKETLCSLIKKQTNKKRNQKRSC